VRKPIIAGNWKMYKTKAEAVAMVNELKPLVASVKEVEMVVCPTFIALDAVKAALAGSAIKLGAQDVYWEKEGAFTGQISPAMLLAVGCEYVIIGHSERRTYFGETNETVNKKVKAALAAGLKPIMCVGERLEEREAGKTNKVVEDHVVNGLAGLTVPEMERMVIAYEPVWAIGTGKTATPAQAEEVHVFIRSLINKLYGKQIADSIRIQYGGSVKPENTKELMNQPDIDGALVGGASLKADSFGKIVTFKG
jgi:triosephosphate isomerase